MRSVLITFAGLMGLAWSTPVAPVLVLVANGSDITINLSGDTSNNRLLSVVSDAGNNNPSVFDWIGGNGANKSPKLTVGGGGRGGGGGEPASGNAESPDNNAGTGSAALIDALLKRILTAAAAGTEPNIRPTIAATSVDRDRDGGGKSRPVTAAVTRSSEGGTLSGTTESVEVTWSRKEVKEMANEWEDI